MWDAVQMGRPARGLLVLVNEDILHAHGPWAVDVVSRATTVFLEAVSMTIFLIF